jgi:hypothetical protein
MQGAWGQKGTRDHQPGITIVHIHADSRHRVATLHDRVCILPIQNKKYADIVKQ